MIRWGPRLISKACLLGNLTRCSAREEEGRQCLVSPSYTAQLLHSDYQIDSRQLEWGWGVERSCGKKRCRCSCSLPPDPIVGAGADAAFVLSLNDDDHDHDHDGGGRYYGARFEN